MPEMPFPIGSTISNLVDIIKLNGSTILHHGGRLDVVLYDSGGNPITASSFANLLSALESGTYVKQSGSVTNDATIYTVPANKRLMIFTGTMHCNNNTPIVQFTINGTAIQDSLLIINTESYILHKTASMILAEENYVLKIEYLSGGGASNAARYLLVGVLIDKV